jgi:hypothetical protein
MSYYVSEPLDLSQDSGKILFHDVLFFPHLLDPPRQTYSFVTFADGKKEALLVGFDKPAFSENVNPQAGFVQRDDGYHLLVSVNSKGLSTPEQFKEESLIDEGYIKQEYALMPYGFKDYFVKVEPPTAIGSLENSRCLFTATFPLRFEETAHVSMKFPRDLEWAGGYDNSTFFVVDGRSFSYTDESKKTTTANEPFVFHTIEPVLDPDYIGIDFTLGGGLKHLVINSTNVFEQDNMTSIPCKMAYEEPRNTDYYDRVLPISQQMQFLNLSGFPPDSFVCRPGLVGAVKGSNEMPACVYAESKQKLIERGWAKDFSGHEN